MTTSPPPTNGLPDWVWDELARVGPIWGSNVSGHVQQMVDLFSALHKDVPRDGVEEVYDLAYGPHPRHRLDIYAAPGLSKRPVVVFVHGGAFVAGHRNRSDEIYANVLRYFARHGYAGYGGDPANIFLACHSAGAAHVCGYLFDPNVPRAEEPDVRGLIVISGRVRADMDDDNPNAGKVSAYYGDDASLYALRSPVSHVKADVCPVFVAFAEYENPLIDIYCLELAYRLALDGRRAPEVLRLNRHNHTSIIGHINTGEDELGLRLRGFIDRHASQAAVNGLTRTPSLTNAEPRNRRKA